MDEWLDLCLRVACAILVGGLVGVNRDLRGRPTGVRLHALVSLASALFVMDVLNMGEAAPTRVIQGIVGGIGFLGAGVIFRQPSADSSKQNHSDVRHLSTAASIWLTSALGVAAGLANWRLVIIATVGALCVLTFGEWIDHALITRAHRNDPNDRNVKEEA